MVSTRSASAALNTPRRGPSPAPAPASLSPTKRTARSAIPPSTTPSTSTSPFIHIPSRFALVWLIFSIPLVTWDLLFVFLRPHTFPGGSLHWPIWVPYAIQTELDLTYGTKKFEEGDGWNAAQSAMNAVENLVYLVYLGLWWRYKDGEGRVGGRVGAGMLVGLFGGAVFTTGKTVLYWLNEAFSGFANIGHNEPLKLFIFWVIPNGAWIVVPAIIAYQAANEMINALVKSPGAGSTANLKKTE